MQLLKVCPREGSSNSRLGFSFVVCRALTNYGKKSPCYFATNLWNSLPLRVKESETVPEFDSRTRDCIINLRSDDFTY